MTYAYDHTVPTEHVVASSDGTPIAYRTIQGSGSAVIIVPGAVAMASDLDHFARALAGHGYTAHTVERRGRGASGDRQSYSIELECDDLAAVQSATGARLVFGHSFGGLIALEAAARTATLTGITVYEPGVSIDGSVPTGWTEACSAQVASGHGLDAFTTFVRGINPTTSGRVPQPLMKQILRLALPADERNQKQLLLPTAVREHLEAARFDNTHLRYAAIACDVLLLAGGRGPTAKTTQRTVSRLQAVIPHAQLHTFPRLDHFGPEKEPERLTPALAQFFAASGSVVPQRGRTRAQDFSCA